MCDIEQRLQEVTTCLPVHLSTREQPVCSGVFRGSLAVWRLRCVQQQSGKLTERALADVGPGGSAQDEFRIRDQFLKNEKSD